MAKFHIRLKLQGLELEVDGERADIPAITAAVQQQFAGLIQPAQTMADGNKQLETSTEVVDVEMMKPKSRAGKRRSGTKGSSDATSIQPLDLRHDAAKYGNPQQGWNTTDKSIWCLFILDDMGVATEVSGPQLAATFKHHFRAAGAIHPPLLTRELGKAKLKVPALVGEDKKQDPSLWYLTDEGKKFAQQLIQNMLNPA